MTNPADDFFGGGNKSISFKDAPIGTTYAGTITRVGEPMQERDPVTGTGKVFDNGDPRMQLPVDLQTSMREDSDDDGIRTLYVKGQMRTALRDAIRAAKADGLRVGGSVTVTLIEEKAPTRPGLNGAKVYSAAYVAPAPGAAFLGVPEQPAAAAPAPPAVPATPPPVAAAPVAAGPDPVALAKQLFSAGLDDATVAASTGLPIAAVAALRAA